MTNNPLLEVLDLNTNSIVRLNTEKCPLLRELLLNGNVLTELNVSKNLKLETLHIGANQISTIDLAGLSCLTHFHCEEQASGMERLDLTPCTSLVYIVTYDNKMKELKLPSTESLLKIEYYDEELTSLDVTKNEKLVELFCENNQIQSIDLAHNADLRKFRGRKNPLRSLDLSNSPLLTRIEMKETATLQELILPTTLAEAVYVELNNCALDVCTINPVIDALNSTYVQENPQMKKLFIANNPGTPTCNTQAAVAKHWVVDATGNGTGCPESIEQMQQAKVDIWTNATGIGIRCNALSKAVVYSLVGEVLACTDLEKEASISLAQGVYVVRVGDWVQKVVVE